LWIFRNRADASRIQGLVRFTPAAPLRSGGVQRAFIRRIGHVLGARPNLDCGTCSGLLRELLGASPALGDGRTVHLDHDNKLARVIWTNGCNHPVPRRPTARCLHSLLKLALRIARRARPRNQPLQRLTNDSGGETLGVRKAKVQVDSTDQRLHGIGENVVPLALTRSVGTTSESKQRAQIHPSRPRSERE
jgi:hypothetical protein